MIRRPPRSTLSSSSAASDVYKRQAEPLGLQVREQLDVLALAAADNRGEHLKASALGQLEDPVDDLLRGLPGDRAAAAGAVRPAGPGVEQPLSLIHISEPTRLLSISYAVFCLKKKKKKK